MSGELEIEQALAELLCREREKGLSVFESMRGTSDSPADIVSDDATASTELELEIASVKAMAELLRGAYAGSRNSAGRFEKGKHRYTSSEIEALRHVADEAERLLLRHAVQSQEQ